MTVIIGISLSASKLKFFKKLRCESVGSLHSLFIIFIDSLTENSSSIAIRLHISTRSFATIHGFLSGVKFAVSVHASSKKEIAEKKIIRELVSRNEFDEKSRRKVVFPPAGADATIMLGKLLT